MNNARQETIADIVAEMRNESHAGDASCLEWVGSKIRGYADRIEAATKREREAGADAAHQLEVAELRECLKEAIREKCPFTRMSCKHGEPCDYECGTDKWRNALREKGCAK